MQIFLRNNGVIPLNMTERKKKNKTEEHKGTQTIGLRSFIIYYLLLVYFIKTFACLQMYIASAAATASTASENIINIIIVFPFSIFSCYPFLFILLTLQRYEQ